MKINLTNLDEFIEEANKLSKNATGLERGIFVAAVTTDETRANSISTRQRRTITASFVPAGGEIIVTYKVDLGSKEFMHAPKDEEIFEDFVAKHEHALGALRQQLTDRCPNSGIYSGTLEP